MKRSTPYSLISRVANFYDFFLWLSGYEREVNYFIDQLPFDKEVTFTVLDTACGTGLYSLAILKKYPHARVIAFDINTELVERLHYKLKKEGLDYRARLFTGNVLGPLKEITDDKFDLVITAGILEHVPIETAVTYLSKFVVTGGYFLNSPAKYNLFGKLVDWIYGCWPYSRSKNIKVFTDNGFILRKLIVPHSFKELHIFQKVL